MLSVPHRLPSLFKYVFDHIKPLTNNASLSKVVKNDTKFWLKKKEVIVRAKYILTDNASEDTHSAETDNWGDFWFRGLEDDRTFTLSTNKGKKSKTVNNIVTDKDLSLGDIPMG